MDWLKNAYYYVKATLWQWWNTLAVKWQLFLIWIKLKISGLR